VSLEILLSLVTAPAWLV